MSQAQPVSGADVVVGATADVSDGSFREYVVTNAVQTFQHHQLGNRGRLDPITAVEAAVGVALYLWIHQSTPAADVVAIYRAVETAADLVRADQRVENLTQRARQRFADLDAQDAEGGPGSAEAQPVAGGLS